MNAKERKDREVMLNDGWVWDPIGEYVISPAEGNHFGAKTRAEAEMLAAVHTAVSNLEKKEEGLKSIDFTHTSIRLRISRIEGAASEAWLGLALDPVGYWQQYPTVRRNSAADAAAELVQRVNETRSRRPIVVPTTRLLDWDE